jgi:hypothetical protein
MVALARLIIVTQHTSSIDDERQPIFELVARSTSWPRQLRNDDLNERAESSTCRSSINNSALMLE